MKMMLVVARLNIGGVALNVMALAEALQALPDCQVILVHGQIGPTEGDMSYLAAGAHYERLELASLGRELSPLRDLATLWELWRLMRRVRPEVVHTHTAKAGWVGRWAAVLAGVPVRVHTFHGHVFSGYFSPAKTRLFLWLERIAARLSSRIITLSDSLKAELASTYHITRPDQIEVLPLGLNLGPLHQNPSPQGHLRARYGLGPEHILIGVVGRLVPVKNHALFLQAAQMSLPQHPLWRFFLVGDGELRPALETQIEALVLGGRAFITGWESDLGPVYGDLDLVTISSDNEGTPVSLIEALAAGVPVVGTDVGGVGDVLGPELAAYVIPPSDAKAMLAAWEAALQTPPSVLESAGARIMATYDIQASARAHLQLYKQLFQKGRLR
jgi:glycosyltransferase involved in cell wall biosynthesis